MSRPRKVKNWLMGRSFVPHRREMLESAAWQVLTINGRRVLDRLELEHMQHAGKDNGKLKCTRDDFQRFGIRRQSISEALAEVEALGFLEVTRRGFKGSREVSDRLPSLYRLTYVIDSQEYADPPTDEWRRPTSREEAECLVRAALAELSRRRAARPTPDEDAGRVAA